MDSTFNLAVARSCRNQLGEGVTWNDPTATLSWVDIANGRLFEWRPGEEDERRTEIGGELGAAVPRAGGGYVLAVDRELRLLDPDGATTTVAAVEPDLAENRINDCRCDPAGRLWAGSMSKPRHQG